MRSKGKMVIATTITCTAKNGAVWYWKDEKASDGPQKENNQKCLNSNKNQIPNKGQKFTEKINTENTTTDFYNNLINEARFIPGNDNDIVPLDEIPRIDKSLINDSASFHRKFFTLIIFANTSALLLGFAIKPNSAVLLRTGKLHDPEFSFKRYLSTIQRIGKFFALPFDMKEAYKSFQTVRKMHALASQNSFKSHPTPETLKLHEPWKTELASAIRKDLDYIDTSSAPSHALTWNPPVPISQFDMAITQFGFWGSIWLSPMAFGIKNRDKEMRGVIHMWEIFGRLLGIRDKYNICLKPDPLLYDKLFRNLFVESLKMTDETVVTIQSAFMKAFSKRVPFATYKSFLFLSFQEWEGFTGHNLWNLMSWKDKASLKFMEVGLWMMRNSALFRIVVNLVFGLWLQLQFWLHLPNTSWPAPQYLYHKMK